MNRLIGVLLALFLLLVDAEWFTLDDANQRCRNSTRTVCVSFVYDHCKVFGQKLSEEYVNIGLVWNRDVSCDGGEIHHLFAKIEIAQQTLSTWTFQLLTAYKATYIRFLFGSNELSFPNASTAQLSWTFEERNVTSLFPIEQLENFNRGSVMGYLKPTFYRYKFNISIEGEKLANLLSGPTIVYTYGDGSSLKITMADDRYARLIEEYAPCEPSELEPRIVCHDTSCDEVEIEYRKANCSSGTFWFSESGLTRNWQAADTISCDWGKWHAGWKDSPNSTLLDSSYEVQCSAAQPAAMTSRLRRILLGVGIGGGVLLLLIVILLVLFMRRRKLHGNKDATRSESDARTPGTSSKKKSQSNRNTELEGKRTNVEDKAEPPKVLCSAGIPAAHHALSCSPRRKGPPSSPYKKKK